MTTNILSLLVFTALSSSGSGEFYDVGSNVTDFKLKNIDGNMVSLSDYTEARGFVVIFTCNHCGYAQAYQHRIIALDQTYKNKGYPVIAISSTNAERDPRDSYENMVIRAQEMGYTFPYLYDADQKILAKFGAQSTPTAYVLHKNGQNELTLKYIGAIDDNYQNPAAVKVHYVENALDALLSGSDPQNSYTKAIGCNIVYNEGESALK